MDEHIRTAAAAARVAVAAEVPWRIKKEWLDSVTWFVSLPDPSAKMRQRYATPGFIQERRGQHEHVVPRLWLRQRLLEAPDQAEAILAMGVACNVTKSEHRRLTAARDAFGWQRYIEAGVDVVDTETDSLVDLVRLATDQRAALAALNLGTHSGDP